MANYKRGKCRKHCPRSIRGSTASWRAENGLPARPDPGMSWYEVEWHPYKDMMHSYPAWWDRSMHTPQWRAKSRQVVRRIVRGDDPDDMVMPIYNKPHRYYW